MTGLTIEDAQADRALFAEVVDLLRQHKTAPQDTALEFLLREAMDRLQAFLGQQPESVPALRLAAEVCQQLGELDRTRDYIQQAEILDPWNLEILIISESLWEEESQRQPSTPGQVPFLDSRITSGVVSTENLIEKAMGSFRLGQLDRAYSLAKLAFRIEPDKGHHLLDVWTVGSALDPQRTKRELALLLPEHEDQNYLYLALGSINTVMGLYPEATNWLERGMAIQTEDRYAYAMILNELAYVLIRQNTRIQAAVQYARRAVELFPDKNANGFIRDTLGLAYLKTQEIDKAIRNLRESVAKDPSVVPRFHLAIALLHERNPADALSELQKVANARTSLESPHIEEITILERVQSHIQRLEELLKLGKADDIQSALDILDGLI